MLITLSLMLLPSAFHTRLKNNSDQGLGISIYNTDHNILALFNNLAQV